MEGWWQQQQRWGGNGDDSSLVFRNSEQELQIAVYELYYEVTTFLQPSSCRMQFMGDCDGEVKDVDGVDAFESLCFDPLWIFSPLLIHIQKI